MGKATSSALLGLLILGGLWWLLAGEGPPAVPDTAPSSDAESERATTHPIPTAALVASQPTELASTTSSAAESPAEHPWPDGLQSMTASGRVLDPAGRAIADAEVFLLPNRRARSELGIDLSESMVSKYGPGRSVEIGAEQLEIALTDSRGRFTLTGPWKLDEERRSNRTTFPTLLVRATGFGVHAFSCAGFAGGSFDAGDLLLHAPAAGLRVRFVDERDAGLAGVSLDLDYDGENRNLASGWPPQGLPAFRAKSDAAGILEIGNLWPGTGEVDFALKGYQRLTRDVHFSPGEWLDLGTVVLEETWRISGVVRDRSGRPLPDVRVTAADVPIGATSPLDAEGDPTYAFACHALEDTEGVVTDDQGRYRLTELSENDFEFIVVAMGAGYEVAALEIGLFALLADAGDHDFALEPESRIVVRAIDARSGERLDNLRVMALRDTGELVKADADESPFSQSERIPWTHPLPIGDGLVHLAGRIGTRLLVEAPGYTQQLHDVPGLAPGDEHEVELRLAPAESLRLQVLDDRGQPVPAAHLLLSPPKAWGTGFHRGVERLRVEALSDDNGLAEFSGLAEGAWELTVKADGHTTLFDGDFVITGRDQSGDLRIARSALLRGRVLRADGSPAVAEEVTWKPGRAYDRTYLTDLEGRFSMRLDAAEGRLLVAEVEPPDLELRAGEELKLELQQLPPCVVSGRLFVKESPLMGGFLHAAGPNFPHEDKQSTRVQGDATGLFHLELNHPGRYRLTLELPDGREHIEEVMSVLGTRVDLSNVFGFASLSGTVLSEAPGADLELAHLMLERDNGWTIEARLDANGDFHFEPLPPGQYSIAAFGGICIFERWGPFELTTGQALSGIELRPELAAEIFGKLRWANTIPVQGELVLHPRLGGDPLRHPIPKLGPFRWSRLPAGVWDYELVLDDPAVPMSRAAEELLRGTLTLHAGQRHDLNITLPGSPLR